MSFKRLCLIGLFIISVASCRKDERILQSPGTLNFSADTVYFDTVFTRLPGTSYPRSINKRFMVRNPYKESVNVNVRLGKGDNSEYRINVDGKSGVFSTLEILPEDSAWVFVEASLEPNQLTQPAIVRDEIEFETNGNRQYVHLAAYGWDAYYFKDTVLESNASWILTDKPYVIVNTCFVDEGVTLAIGPGIHVYSSTNSVLYDTNNVKYGYHALNVLGTLKINGTQSNPVIFEGDRLDNNFADVPGQWQGIGFYRTSKDNEITHAIIKNATYGIRVDSLSLNANPKLTIRNSIVKNMSGIGIWGRTGDIFAINTAVSNCAMAWFYAQIGGTYEFIHCSMSNTTSGGKDPHLVISNQQRDENKVVIKTYPIGYTFLNCILWGPNDKELGFDLSSPVIANPQVIQKNIIKYNSFSDTLNIYNADPQFVNAAKNDLKIKATSPAKDKAIPGVTIDLEDFPRDTKPDIGAYEFH